MKKLESFCNPTIARMYQSPGVDMGAAGSMDNDALLDSWCQWLCWTKD